MKSKSAQRQSARGWIAPVGGAEKKGRHPGVLTRFAELCGGDDARIVIIATASSLPDTAERYAAVFGKLGVHADIADFQRRKDGSDPRFLEMIAEADGLWMTGGNQMRLATIIGGTPAERLIVERNQEGMHVAGTSAGAAIMSRHMIAVGKPGPTPKQGMATLSPGFGLLDSVVVDQHFRERDRLGRLLAAISFNPRLVGIGVDEDTGAFIDPEDVMMVVGAGGVTVVDPSDISDDSLAEARAGGPIRMTDIRLHILLEGDRYDLNARRPLFRPSQAGSEAATKRRGKAS